MARIFEPRAWLLAAATIFGSGLAPLPALADLVVLQSSAPSLRAGVVLADAVAIDIPAGKSAVFVLPNGATKTVSGPFKGTAGDLTKGIAVDRDLMAQVKTYVETGGATASRVGATRSAVARPSAPSGVAFLGWGVVPISVDGDYCVDGDSRPKLVRTMTGAPLTVTLVDLVSSKRAPATFAAGSSEAAWPAEIAIANGVSYAITAPQTPLRRFRLRLVKPLPAADDTLRVLHGQRCLTQMQAVLGGLMRRAAAGQ